MRCVSGRVNGLVGREARDNKTDLWVDNGVILVCTWRFIKDGGDTCGIENVLQPLHFLAHRFLHRQRLPR